MRTNEARNARGGMGKMLGLGCLGAIVLFGGIAILVVVLTKGQVKIVETHLAGMRSKDLDAAFSQIDGQHITKEQLKMVLDLNPQVWGSADVSFPSRKVETVNGREEAEIVASIKGTDGKDYKIRYVLYKTGDDWKIAGINSQDIALAPPPLAIQGAKVTQKKLEDGQTEVRIDFDIVGCGSRKAGEKFEYEVSLKGKLVDASGAVLAAEQELGRFKDSLDQANAPISGHHDYTLPAGVSGEIKATVIVEDVISGKGASQIVPVKVEK